MEANEKAANGYRQAKNMIWSDATVRSRSTANFVINEVCIESFSDFALVLCVIQILTSNWTFIYRFSKFSLIE